MCYLSSTGLTDDNIMSLRKATVLVRRSANNGLDVGKTIRCNNLALRKASRRVSQLFDTVLAPTGLRSTQRSILLTIAHFGNPTMGQLAASLVLDRSALGHNLKPLERDGLVALDVDPEDRRNKLARLTKKGESKLKETTALWEIAQARFENKFGVKKARALRETLALIAAEAFDDLFEAPAATAPGRRRKRSTEIG
jgi:DNA-binding MarR family transcriptional regulator